MQKPPPTPQEPAPGARTVGDRLSATAAVLAAIFGLSLIALAVMYRPWSTPGIGYDTASSVLFFDRLAAHLRLEAFIDTTPKPLATLLDGASFNLFHDWRVLAVVSIVAYGAMLAAAAALAWRAAGPVAAGMAAAGLLGCQLLLLDGALTYVTPWAILLWLVAGLALTSSPPRYLLAGFALFLGALTRVETFIILAVAAAALLAWRMAPAGWIGVDSRPPRRSALVLVGVTALPVMVLHDLLLTGNGLFWLDVSAIFSQAHPASVTSAGDLARQLTGRYVAVWPLLLLAAVAVVDLFRRRHFVVLLGLVACGPGVLAFLEVLAFRHTYVSYRYTIPADAALIFAAAIGAGALVRAGVALASRRGNVPASIARLAAGSAFRDRLAVAVAAVAVGAIVAAAVVRPFGPLDRATWRTMGNYQALQSDAERARLSIDAALAQLPDPPARIETDLTGKTPGPPPRLYVPPMLVPGMIVDLGLPAWSVGGGTPLDGDPATLSVDAVTIVYIDAHLGGDVPADDRPFEVSVPTRVGRVMVEPMLALPSDGLWVVVLRPLTS